MAELPPASGAVQGGGLVELRIDVGQGRQVDDRAPADVLPDVAGDVDGPEPLRPHQEGRAPEAQEGQEVVHHPVGGDEVDDHAADHHQRDEVRHVGDRLDGALEGDGAHLVEHHRQDDRRREADGQAEHLDQHGVAHQRPEVGVGQVLLEVLEADAGGGEYRAQPAEHLDLLERDQHPVHGRVLEQHVEQERRREHQVQVPRPVQLAPDRHGRRRADPARGADAVAHGSAGV